MSDLPVPESLLPPVWSQKRVIGNDLNASMVSSFLMGAYSLVYFGTLYLYLSKKGAKQRYVVVSAITLLYLTCTSLYALNWWGAITFAIVQNGQSRASTYIATAQYPQAHVIAALALQCLLFIISDGLLIWRCFHVWNQSWLAISVPSFLLLAEVSISLGIIILDVHTPDAAVITETEAALRNNLQSSEFFITFGTTIITTSLIAYRIYSTARLDGITSLGRFKHIVEVLIQSAAFYSLVILATAIMMVIPTYLSRPNGMFNAELFVDSILPIVGGLAPTIVVTRLVMQTPEDTHVARTTNLTGLHFQTQPVSQSDTERGLGSVSDYPKAREKSSHDEEKAHVEQVIC